MPEKPKQWKKLTSEEKTAFLNRRKGQKQLNLIEELPPEEQLRQFTERQLQTRNFDERLSE